MSIQQSIVTLVARNWSRRRIARELGLDRETVARYAKLAEAKPATNVAPGFRPGPPSLCAPFTLQIEDALQAGLSAQRIYQDLVSEQRFGGAYGSVKRFVRSLGHTSELPFRRMECAPGDELQIDFGMGAWNQGRRPPSSSAAPVSCGAQPSAEPSSVAHSRS